VTEACTNVLKHAVGTPDAYETTVEINENDCTIRVIDSGQGFDSAQFGREEALGTAESGRGIQLIRALVDTVEFTSRPEDGTVVHLEKRLEFNPDSILQRLADAST
jgi:serine/threonine-protein kinase RsbW